ncbi:MAG: hypothetical protein RL695_60 [Pseudomonadota bacterium]
MERGSVIANMFERTIYHQLIDDIDHTPAVARIGPRQVGKTTLPLEAGRMRAAVYLDLESERDRSKLAQPELYLAEHRDRLVILDEVHRAPALFPVLRGMIDANRRAGCRSGQYLLLGSASFDLLRQAGETLAGRISYLELTPFNVRETRDHKAAVDALWLRGGFPESLLALSGARSLRWRQDFIRSHLEREIPQFAPRLSAETLRRLWTMLAHRQGGLLNGAEFARSLGVDVKTVGSYLDLLVSLLLVRRLEPWHANVGKRLVKATRICVRDSGLVHALLGIADKEVLLGRPVVGASWEGHVVESLLTCVPQGVQGSFYRTSGGAEIDRLLSWPGGQMWAIEIKRSLQPRPERGFHVACDDLQPSRKMVVYPGDERYPLAADIEAMPLLMLCEELAAAG